MLGFEFPLAEGYEWENLIIEVIELLNCTNY